MQPQPPDAPLLTVDAVRGPGGDAASMVDEQRADIGLIGGGRLRVEREGERVSFAMPDLPPDADLLHPYLAPAAALVWHWRGKEALHAGAVAVGAGAVLVVGAKEAGKSTTLAWLAEQRGTLVMADDLSVIAGGRVLAGPRGLDIRVESDVVAGGEVVREGERRRLLLEPVPPSLPVIGAVLLRWGDGVSLDPVPAAARLQELAGERSYYEVGGDPSAVLDLAGLPMVWLTRPQSPDSLPAVADALLSAFG